MHSKILQIQWATSGLTPDTPMLSILCKLISVGSLYFLQLLCNSIQDEIVQNAMSSGLDS